MRVVSHIAEVTDMSGEHVLMQDIGLLAKDMNFIVSSGLMPKRIEQLENMVLAERCSKRFLV